MHQTLEALDLNYPSAIEWMWNYCLFLGKFTDSNGNKFDLGVNANVRPSGTVDISLAIVDGDTPGNFISGDVDFYKDRDDNQECVAETLRRISEVIEI